MTDRNVPYRIEIDVEVPGTPEQVWHALATEEGIGSWMAPAEFEARPGAELAFHMGPDATSRGRVTEVEVGRRIVYEEDWATFMGPEGADVEPLVTEFVVEARSGGTCVVHVVTSSYGVGAEWERETFDQMSEGWAAVLDNLRLYLTHYPDQHATPMWVNVELAMPAEAVIDSARRKLGVDGVGDRVDERVSGRGIAGRVERSTPLHVLVKVESPVDGLLSFYAYEGEEGSGLVLQGYFFSADAAAYVERELAEWETWLNGLTADVEAVRSS
jgi:uncharacterized protein YndB with AHSA1/START domain